MEIRKKTKKIGHPKGQNPHIFSFYFLFGRYDHGWFGQLQGPKPLQFFILFILLFSLAIAVGVVRSPQAGQGGGSFF
jgi:hypothetical protein